jgi:hypothetical protein
MKLNKLHIIYIFVATIGLWTLSSNSTGIKGVSTTGCGGGCHGTINSATSISMDFDGNSSLTSYTPGKKYTIVLNIDNSNLIGTATAKAGFDLNFSSGTLSNTPAGTALTARELNHTTPKAMTSGSASFTFDWTAPAAGSGNVTINIAANGVNGTGDVTGDAWNLKTISLTELVTTKASISSVASAAITSTDATINAQINANGSNTTAEVQYGLTTAYGSTKAMSPASITGTTNTAATASLTGLTPNTTYNYRIKATNSKGDSFSVNSTFKTNTVAGPLAKISSISSTSITVNSATINAQINANGSNTTAEVQYGLTTSYGSTKAMTPATITGTANTAATASLTGLTANTTYNYRIKASNSAGDTLIANNTFKTNSAGSAILNTANGAINLHPNPSSDYTIISGDDLSLVKDIVAVNMSGKRFSLPIVYTKSDQIKLNTSGLSKGKYFIQIQSGDKTSALPLLID